MMSQTGSVGTVSAPALVPALFTVLGRSVRPPGAAAVLSGFLALTFMSAMLTYFDYMLQKPRQRRKDRTGKNPSAIVTFNRPVVRRPGQSYRVFSRDAKYWKWR